VWGTKARWQRIEPGPTKSRTWAAIVGYATLAICIASLAGWFGVLVRQTVRWENLRTRGVIAPADIMYTQSVDDGDNGSKYYVHAVVERCNCIVVVRVRTQDHNAAAPILVRYDPRDTSNAVPLIDRPPNHLAAGVVAFIATVVPCAALAGWWLRRRRRCRNLFRRSAEQRPVTFSAWKRSLGNTHHFLVLYEAGASERDEPICCVPVPAMYLRRLRADDELLLYGCGARPAVALRHGRRAILPCGPAKPGRWEQALRDDERR
jgi:hypothetical protein